MSSRETGAASEDSLHEVTPPNGSHVAGGSDDVSALDNTDICAFPSSQSGTINKEWSKDGQSGFTTITKVITSSDHQAYVENIDYLLFSTGPVDTTNFNNEYTVPPDPIVIPDPTLATFADGDLNRVGPFTDGGSGDVAIFHLNDDLTVDFTVQTTQLYAPGRYINVHFGFNYFGESGGYDPGADATRHSSTCDFIHAWIVSQDGTAVIALNQDTDNDSGGGPSSNNFNSITLFTATPPTTGGPRTPFYIRLQIIATFPPGDEFSPWFQFVGDPHTAGHNESIYHYNQYSVFMRADRQCP